MTGRKIGVILSGVTLLVMLGAVELLLRLGIIPNEPQQRWIPVRASGSPGPRILILGDSFFTRRASSRDISDDLVDELSGTGAEVLNPSYPGYGPYQYLEMLVQGSSFEPDIVLVAHYVGNDLMDVGCNDDPQARIRSSERRTWSAMLPRSFLALYATARFKDYATRHPAFDWAALEAAGIPKEEVDRARRFELNPYVLRLGATYPNYYRDVLLFQSDCAEQAWQRTRVVLDEILRQSSAMGARVFPVVFPHTLQVSRLHYDLYRQWKILVDDTMLETSEPQDRLRAYYREKGIEVVDLLPAFRASTAPLYWVRDEHLNPDGDALSAKEIGRALHERGLVRPGSS
jgi:hypothetical protein